MYYEYVGRSEIRFLVVNPWSSCENLTSGNFEYGFFEAIVVSRSDVRLMYV